MSDNTKLLKRKMSSIKALTKITKAMELVSRGKMKCTVDAAMATRSFAVLALELLHNISVDKNEMRANSEIKSAAYLAPGKKGDKVLVLYIASNKGLCGGYNVTIFKALREAQVEADFITVGKYAARNARKLGGKILAEFNDLPEITGFSDLQELFSRVLLEYGGGNYKQAYLVYTNFMTVFLREPRVVQFLPVTEEALEKVIELPREGDHKHQFLSYLYEPSPEAVLDRVIPELISMQIFQALLESRASEESARMVAMKTATDNGFKLSEELSQRYNRARQASITTEIVEIAAGANAFAE